MTNDRYRRSLERAKRYQHYDNGAKAKYAQAARKKFGSHWITPIIIIITDIYGNIYEAATDYQKRRSRKEIDDLEQETIKLNRSLARWTFALAVFSTLTFFVNLGTLWVLKGQLSEMHGGGVDTHNLADAAKNQSDYTKTAVATARDAYIADNRAFIGPSDASIQALAINSGIKANIIYKNTGREPVAMGYTARAFAADAEQFLIAYPVSILNNTDSCMITENLINNFIFPNSGFTQYSISIDTADELTIPKLNADQDLIDGIKTLYIYGCMTYKSLGVVRHTAFCYSYRAKKPTFLTSAFAKMDGMQIRTSAPTSARHLTSGFRETREDTRRPRAAWRPPGDSLRRSPGGPCRPLGVTPRVASAPEYRISAQYALTP